MESALDARGNVVAGTQEHRTSQARVRGRGYTARAVSVGVAIREGKQCARAIDAFLMGQRTLRR